MDSLTQMALGAACGEVVLGKKIGNRAMLWGAIGGTIPDLDVLGNFFLDEVGALAFHRSITHSLLFACLAPLLLSWVVHRLYSSNFYREQKYKTSIFTLNLLFFGLIVFGINFVPYSVSGEINWTALAISSSVFIGIVYWLYSRYSNSSLDNVFATRKEWAWLFFWSIFTHPLLDCCTAYGTQLFQPFWDYRVAFNNISVVDPLYTMWFLIFLTIAGYLSRNSPKRKMFTWFAISFSSIYLLFTFYHKNRMDSIFEKSLIEQNIPYNRFMTAPTIFNNVLWTCLAEGDTVFYQGLYSFWDKEEKVKDLNVIPKNHHLVEKYKGTRQMETLTWFSNDYYSIQDLGDSLRFNDLRYGSMSSDTNNFVFNFILKEQENGKFSVEQPENPEIKDEEFKFFIKRIKGF